MGPYSKDLRERVAAAVDHGEGSARDRPKVPRQPHRSSSACSSGAATPALWTPSRTGVARPLPWDPTTGNASRN